MLRTFVIALACATIGGCGAPPVDSPPERDALEVERRGGDVATMPSDDAAVASRTGVDGANADVAAASPSATATAPIDVEPRVDATAAETSRESLSTAVDESVPVRSPAARTTPRA